MLNFIYYPVSAILWFWHKVFGFFLGSSNGFAWALSVIFLVFTLRAVLYRPFVKQIRTQRQMQEFQPQIKALQKKYKGDKARLAQEMQKLQKENGFNPVAGCLPVLLQAPVFIGLFHVLRSFNRTGTMAHVPFLSPTAPMSPEQNAITPNYVFGADDVQSFLSARLFGAPISSRITESPAQLQAFQPDVPHSSAIQLGQITLHFAPSIAAVAIPMMIVASIATHFTARASVARQSATATANPQSAIMNKLVLWIFPLGVLLGGPFLPIAILLYWLSNNGWTLAQQHYVFGMMAKEAEAKKVEAIERRGSNAPKPGARPEYPKGKKPKVLPASSPDMTDSVSTDTADSVDLKKPGTTPKKSTTGGLGTTGVNGKPTSKSRNAKAKAGNGTPRPGSSTAKPGSSTAKAGNGTAKPGSSPAKPGNSTAKAGNGTAKPGNGTAKPGNSTATPKVQPNKSKSKSGRGSRKKR